MYTCTQLFFYTQWNMLLHPAYGCEWPWISDSIHWNTPTIMQPCEQLLLHIHYTYFFLVNYNCGWLYIYRAVFTSTYTRTHTHTHTHTHTNTSVYIRLFGYDLPTESMGTDLCSISLRISKLLLQPTVSRPIFLGVGSPFEAHDQILNFPVWHFLTSSRRVPSLTRGRVCNLQCNHSQIRVAQDP
jgi:hypothetical protein